MQKLQCEICGGSLIMAEDGEGALCESCGMRFKKETVKKMVMELSGPIKIDGPVQVEGIQGASALAERAETFLHLGESGKANDAFQQLTNEYPSDYRGWWGLTRLFDWRSYFYELGTGPAQPPIVCKRALQFSEGAAKDEIQRYYEEKVKTVKSKTDARLNAEKESAEKVEQEYQQNLNAFNEIYHQAMVEYQAASQALSDADQHYSNLYNHPPKQYTLKLRGKLIALGLLSLFLHFGLKASSSGELFYNLIFVIPIVALIIIIFIGFTKKSASVSAAKQHTNDFAAAKSAQETAKQAKAAAEHKLNATLQNKPQK